MTLKDETAGGGPTVSAAKRSTTCKKYYTTQRIFGIELSAFVNQRCGDYHPKGGER